MTKDWTVDYTGYEWKPIEWDYQYHRHAVRPIFTNYWLAYGEAGLLNHYGVTTKAYYGKPDQWYRC